MNETTIVQVPPKTELERLRDETSALRQSVAGLERDLAGARGLAEQLVGDIATAENQLISGAIQRPVLADLRGRQREAAALITKFSDDLSLERRLLGKSIEARNTAESRAELEQRLRTRRQIAEILAPFLNATITALDGLLALDGFSAHLNSWAQGAHAENRSQSARFMHANLGILIRSVLSGDVAFCADLIRDFRDAAPDLVSSEMVTFLSRCDRQVADRIRQNQEAQRAQQARTSQAQLMENQRREQLAFERL